MVQNILLIYSLFNTNRYDVSLMHLEEFFCTLLEFITINMCLSEFIKGNNI